MRFKVQAADPETGEEVLWEIEAPTVQAARQKANDSGYLVGRVRPCSDSGVHAEHSESQANARGLLLDELPSTGTQTDTSKVSESISSTASSELSTANWITWGRALEWSCFVAAITITLSSFVVAGKGHWSRYNDWEFSRAFEQGFLPCVILVLSTGWLWFTEASSTNRAEFGGRFDHPRRMSVLGALALGIAMSLVFDLWDEDAARTPTQVLFGFVVPFAILLVGTVLWVTWLPNAIVECRGARALRNIWQCSSLKWFADTFPGLVVTSNTDMTQPKRDEDVVPFEMTAPPMAESVSESNISKTDCQESDSGESAKPAPFFWLVISLALLMGALALTPWNAPAIIGHVVDVWNAPPGSMGRTSGKVGTVMGVVLGFFPSVCLWIATILSTRRYLREMSRYQDSSTESKLTKIQ